MYCSSSGSISRLPAHPVYQLLAANLFGNTKSTPESVDERSIGRIAAVSLTSPLGDDDLVTIQPLSEFLQQSALANFGLPFHGNELAFAAHTPFQTGVHCAELVIAARIRRKSPTLGCLETGTNL